MLVTLYIVSFNNKDFVLEACESAVAQTYDELEVILFDDGSSDGSDIICKQIAEKYGWKFHSKLNRGLIQIATEALSIASGDFIVRLDGDDVLEVDAIEKLVSAQQIQCADLVYGNYHEIDSQGNVLKSVNSCISGKHSIDFPAHGACTLFNRKLFLDSGGYTDNIDCQDGVDVWACALSCDFKIAHTNENIFRYRQHVNNLTRNRNRLFRSRLQIYSQRSSTQLQEYPPLNIIYPAREVELISNTTAIQERIDLITSLCDEISVKLNSHTILTSNAELARGLFSSNINVVERVAALEGYDRSVHQGLLNNKIFKSQGLSCIVTDIPDGYTRKSLILALKMSYLSDSCRFIPAKRIHHTVLERTKAGFDTIGGQETRRFMPELYEAVGGLYLYNPDSLDKNSISYVEAFAD